jgi:hypothetical protein
VRNALWRYAEAGGALLVLGVVELPTACRVLNKFPNAPDSGQRPECVCYEVTLGRCYVFRNAEAPDRAGARNWAGNAERMLGSAWQRQRSAADTHRVAPVIEEISTPFWSCFGVLSLFSILAGPVAIGVLRNRNRGIWIFWLAPVLGLVTSVIVILSVILGEGVTPSASVAGFTVLDERVGRATTVGINGFYCPVRLRKGLAYSYDTEVTSCRAGDTPFSAAIVPRELVWGERQLLPGQWVRPRIPQYLRLRTNELRKERLGLVRGPDGLSVVNGLGADISRLLVVDFDGRIYEMLDVAAGSQVVARSPLKQAEELRRRDLPTIQPLGSVILEREAWQPKVADVLQWSGLMRPGSYLAYMDSAPFVPNGIQRSAKLMESSIVFGILREEDGQ